MFAPMSVRLAAQGERDRQERAEQLKAERERQEKARLEDERNSPKAVQAQFAERAQAIDARAQELHPPIDAQARAEEQRNAELRLIGDQLAERLAPVITAAIAAGFAQIKDGRHTERNVVMHSFHNVGDVVNVLINPGHTPTTATVVSVDPKAPSRPTHLNGVLTNRTGYDAYGSRPDAGRLPGPSMHPANLGSKLYEQSISRSA